MARRQDIEQQVTQLNAQNSELKMQLSGLNAQLSNLNAQLSEQAAQLKNQNAQLENYRAREQAIVYALTEAKETTDRRLAEADEQARRIIKDAEAQKYVAQRQAEAIEREAEAKAGVIIENAKKEAAKTISDMQIAAREVEGQLQQLNAALKETAQRAYRQAGEFAKSIEGLRMDQEGESPAPQYSAVKEPVPQKPASTQTTFDISMLDDGPEDAFTVPKEQSSQLAFGAVADEYEDPQKVIHGIYQMQGRRIPTDAKEYINRYDAPPPDIETQASAPAGMPSVMPITPQTPIAPQAAPADSGLDGLLDEIMQGGQPAPQQPSAPNGLDGLLDEITGGMPIPPPPSVPNELDSLLDEITGGAPVAPPQSTAQGYASAPPPYAPPAPQQREERLWTVDEVMGSGGIPLPAPGGPFSPEAPGGQGLNSLLDEIMGTGQQQQQAYAPPRQPQADVDLDSLLNDILGN